MTQYYNPMEMPFTQQRTEECSGLTCATNEENNTSGGGWLEGAGSALGGLADVLGVFYGGGGQVSPNGTTTTTTNPPAQPQNNNTMMIIIVVIVLLMLIGLGVFFAIRASKKKS